MNARPTDRLAIAVAQLNPIVGDIAGNADKARRARAQAAARRCRSGGACRNSSCAGYPPEDLVLKPALQAACRAKIEELARETADGGPALLIGTPWVGGRQALQRLLPARPRRHRGGAHEGEPAQLRRVRRAARVRAGPAARVRSTSAACASACRSAKTSGPNGATTRTWSSAWPRPAPSCSSCRTARPTRATRTRFGSTSRSRASPRAVCR